MAADATKSKDSSGEPEVAKKPSGPGARRGFVEILLGTSMGHLFTVGATLLLSRWLTPAHFGEFAALIAKVSVLESLVTMRSGLSLPGRASVRSGSMHFVLSLGVTLVGTFLAFLGLFSFERMTGGGGGVTSLLTALLLLSLATQNLLGQYLAFLGMYRDLALIKGAVSSLRAVMQVGLAASPLAAISLPAGEMIGRFGAILMVGRRVYRQRAPILVGATPKRLKIIASAILRSAPLLVGAGLFNQLGIHMAAIYFSEMVGKDFAGQYAMSLRIVGFPIALVSAACSQVFIGRFASARRGAKGALTQVMRSSLLWIGGGALGGALLSGLMVKPLFHFLLGPEWAPAATLTLMLLPSYALQLASSTVQPVLAMIRRERTLFYWDLGRVLSLVCLFSASLHYEVDPTTQVAWLSLVMAFWYAVNIGICWKLVREMDGDKPSAS